MLTSVTPFSITGIIALSDKEREVHINTLIDRDRIQYLPDDERADLIRRTRTAIQFIEDEINLVPYVQTL